MMVFFFKTYLYKSPFVHCAEYKERVGGPFHVRYLVQAGVELQDLQGAHIPHDKPVLHTGRLCSVRKYDQITNTLTLLTQFTLFKYPGRRQWTIKAIT